MSTDITQFDHYLKDDGPAALVIREYLMPVEGVDGVFFPATYAAAEDKRVFAGGYNIDTFADGRNICLVDSVGSQANRIEPMFDAESFDGKYGKLVPQIVVKAGEVNISIFDAGHRAGDAIVRCSALQQELHDAFKAVFMNDCVPLAKLAPTSLVFGVWDSRDTQVKLPRLVTSTIRAYDVRPITRSAVYSITADYVGMEVFSEKEKEKAEGDQKNPLAKRGFVNALASKTHGGVIADGDIRRDATLSLSAVRLLKAGNAEDTLKLQRYVLGLALTAFTHATTGYLRAGCNLVLNPEKKGEFVEVHGDGRRIASKLTHDAAYTFAELAAEAFGVGQSQTVDFDKNRATADVKAK